MDLNKFIEGFGQIGEACHILYNSVIQAGGTSQEASDIVCALIRAMVLNPQ